MPRPLRLACAVFAAAVASASAASPGTETPSTEDCSVNAEGNGSQDCQKEFAAQVERIAGLAYLTGVVHAHSDKDYGVVVVCDSAKDRAALVPGDAPVSSYTCGTQKIVATGYGLFSALRSCAVGQHQISISETMAAVAAHEIGHLAANHTGAKLDIHARICGKWAVEFKDTDDGKKLVADLKEKYKKQGHKDQKLKGLVIGELIGKCYEYNAAEFAKETKILEQEADLFALDLLKKTDGSRGAAAYYCAMKGVQDYEWLIAPSLPKGHVSDHPEAKARVALAFNAYALSTAKEYCRNLKDNALCKLVSQ